MTEQQTTAIDRCAALSAAGEISFGDVVSRLIEAGVERYHTDYSRGEITYYLPNGASYVIPLRPAPPPVAEGFSAQNVGASVRQAQRGEIAYPRFVRQTAAAGCVGYFVQIAGRRVHYFGRDGGIHTEWFPGAAQT